MLSMLSESKYLADFLVGFLGKKPQTLLIPTYTIVLHDKVNNYLLAFQSYDVFTSLINPINLTI